MMLLSPLMMMMIIIIIIGRPGAALRTERAVITASRLFLTRGKITLSERVSTVET
jgi:hypothetical protein